MGHGCGSGGKAPLPDGEGGFAGRIPHVAAMIDKFEPLLQYQYKLHTFHYIHTFIHKQNVFTNLGVKTLGS